MSYGFVWVPRICCYFRNNDDINFLCLTLTLEPTTVMGDKIRWRSSNFDRFQYRKKYYGVMLKCCEKNVFLQKCDGINERPPLPIDCTFITDSRKRVYSTGEQKVACNVLYKHIWRGALLCRSWQKRSKYGLKNGLAEEVLERWPVDSWHR